MKDTSSTSLVSLLCTLAAVPAIVLCACSRTDGGGQVQIRENLVQSVDLDEIFADIEFVPLEFAEAAPVATVYQSMVADGMIFLNTHGAVSVYSLDGKYVRTIGHKGRGPGEYANVNSFYVSGGYVYILDWNRKLVKYSVDGDFVKEMRLDWFAGSVFACGDKLVVTSGYQNPGNLFNVFDSGTFEPLASFVPVNENRFSYRQFMFPNCFAVRGDDIIYYEELSNEVYSLDLDNCGSGVRYSFDLLGKNPPEGYWDRKFASIIELVEDMGSNGYNRGFSFFQEGDDNIFFTFSTADADTPMLANLYDKRSGRSRQFSSVCISDGIPPAGIRDMHFGFAADTSCVVLPESVFFDEDGNLYEDGLFPPYEPNGNPVVVVGRIR